MTTVCVFGGTGFLGWRLVQRLAADGATVRVAVRHPDRMRSALSGGLGRVAVFRADVRDQVAVASAVAGADAVVNAVSAYVETGGITFEAVHEQGAKTLAREAAAAGVPRFVLVSDRKSIRLNSSHTVISYAVFCLKKKKFQYVSK